MADDALKNLEERLSRIEAALSQQGGASAAFPSGGPIADPAPWGGGGGWGWHWPYHWPPRPIGDPAPFALRPMVDPATFAFRPIADPAAFAHHQQAALGRIGVTGGDPPPIDVSRFSAAQLQAALHSIAAEKARLDSMEKLIKQHLDKANSPAK